MAKFIFSGDNFKMYEIKEIMDIARLSDMLCNELQRILFLTKDRTGVVQKKIIVYFFMSCQSNKVVTGYLH